MAAPQDTLQNQDTKKKCVSAVAEFDFAVTFKRIQSVHCCICFEDVFDVYTLSCSHKYCKWCIAKYTMCCEKKAVVPMCPTCRAPMSLKEKNRLQAYFLTVTDFCKLRRSPRKSRSPLRFTTNGKNWSLY